VLTGPDITTRDDVLDDSGESRVYFPQVELGDPVPYPNLPFEASPLGVGVHDFPSVR
jgi:hypothetical protein